MGIDVYTRFDVFIKLDDSVKDEHGVFPDPWEFCDEHFNDGEILSQYSTEYAQNGVTPNQIWLSNRYGEGIKEKLIAVGFPFNLDDGCSHVIDLSSLNIPEIMKIYSQDEYLNLVLNKLNEIYGESAASLHFGFIKDYW